MAKSNPVAKDLRNSDGKYRMRVETQKKGTGSYDRKRDDDSLDDELDVTPTSPDSDE